MRYTHARMEGGMDGWMRVSASGGREGRFDMI